MQTSTVKLQHANGRRTRVGKFHHVIAFYIGRSEIISQAQTEDREYTYVPLEAALVTVVSDAYDSTVPSSDTNRISNEGVLRRMSSHWRVLPATCPNLIQQDEEFFGEDVTPMNTDKGVVPYEEINDTINRAVIEHRYALGLDNVKHDEVRTVFIGLGYNKAADFDLPVTTHQLATVERVTKTLLLDTTRGKACDECVADECSHACALRAAHLTVDTISHEHALIDEHRRTYDEFYRAMRIDSRDLYIHAMACLAAAYKHLASGKSTGSKAGEARCVAMDQLEAFLTVNEEAFVAGKLDITLTVADVSGARSTSKRPSMTATVEMIGTGEAARALIVPLSLDDFDETGKLASAFNGPFAFYRLPSLRTPHNTGGKKRKAAASGGNDSLPAKRPRIAITAGSNVGNEANMAIDDDLIELFGGPVSDDDTNGDDAVEE